MVVPHIIVPHKPRRYKKVNCKGYELLSVDFTIRTLIHFPQYESICYTSNGMIIHTVKNLLPSCDYGFQRNISIRAKDYYSNIKNIDDYVINLNKTEIEYSYLINEVLNKVKNDREYSIEDFITDKECHYREYEYTKEVPV